MEALLTHQFSNGGRSKQANSIDLSAIPSLPQDLYINNTNATYLLLFTFAPNGIIKCASTLVLLIFLVLGVF